MWFFNKKENKKYISCDLIEHGMDVFVNSINFCCRIPLTEKGYKKIIDNFHGDKLDWKKFFAIKRKYREQMKKGKMIPECKNCIYLEEKEWDNEDYISFINFNNWTTCNAFCVYCNIHELHMQKETQYNVYPVIKDLADNGYLRKGGHITIAGGEPCVAPEFNNLLNLFLEYDINPIRVLTNASIYSESVENGIKKGNVNIVVSVDSGTRETFEKIKKYNKYDEVWANIKRYASVQPQSDRVKTKFILIPGFNDSEEEINLWLKKSVDFGVKHVAFDVEMAWYLEHANDIPEHVMSLVKYTLNKIEEYGLNVELIDRGRILADKIKTEV